MNHSKWFFANLLVLLMLCPSASFAASHREAPITALDRAADITDIYAFVSYDNPNKVTFIMNVDPLLAPQNGPTYFPFDPDITYRINVDNTNSATANVVFEFRFQTEFRAPDVFTAYIGAGNGIPTPTNAPAPSAPGTLVIPPAITALDGNGSQGLNLRQTYTVTMVKGTGSSATRTDIANGTRMFAVPTNVGPRTMPNYPALAAQGIYTFGDVKVFAGTVDDPFYIDLGAVFDTLNLRASAFPGGTVGVLTAAQDASAKNTAPDAVAGLNVNTIAIEVPISMLMAGGVKLPATNPGATIGVWGTTSRPRTTIRRGPNDPAATPADPTVPADLRQIQRMGNPLINETIIGIGSKDLWSISDPSGDSQFARFALDPLLARALNAAFGIKVPDTPRNDLLLLLQYLPPIAAPGTTKGPIADLLRLNTGVPPTPAAARSRLGVLGGDLAGWPNGRRITDDVTDIALRAVAGALVPSVGSPALGDGVNSNDVPTQETFPYEAFAHSGLETPPAPPVPTTPANSPNVGSNDCVRNPLACTGTPRP